MDNLSNVEEYYKKVSRDILKWLPEGIQYVDLSLLNRFDLLDFYNQEKNDAALACYFHVIESKEKLTLINDQFIVWIVPEKINDMPITYTLIALNHEEDPQLEMAFASSGVYNSSRLVLRVLEKFLHEIQENEDVLFRIRKST